MYSWNSFHVILCKSNIYFKIKSVIDTIVQLKRLFKWNIAKWCLHTSMLYVMFYAICLSNSHQSIYKTVQKNIIHSDFLIRIQKVNRKIPWYTTESVQRVIPINMCCLLVWGAWRAINGYPMFQWFWLSFAVRPLSVCQVETISRNIWILKNISQVTNDNQTAVFKLMVYVKILFVKHVHHIEICCLKFRSQTLFYIGGSCIHWYRVWKIEKIYYF